MPANEIELFMASIRALESGGGDPRGNYSAVGVYTGRMGRALGAYQIMSANWPSWAAQAGLSGADWRDPRAQDAVARHKMMAYYRAYGRWDAVAVAWFAGPGRVRDFLRGANLSGTRDALGTSVPKYVKIINGYMDKFRSQYGPGPDPSDDRYVNRLAQQARSQDRGATSGSTSGAAAPDPYNRAYLASLQARIDSQAEALGEFGLGIELPEVDELAGPSEGALLTALLESISARIAGGEPVDPGNIGAGSGLMTDQFPEEPEDDLREL